MLRLLSEVAMVGNTKSPEQGLISTVLPLLKLLSLAIFGLILGHKKTQIVPKETFKLLSKLVFALFLPCLIFIHLGQSITLDNFVHWWFIPVNVLLSTLVGFVLGVLVVIICRPPQEFTRFTIIMTAFGNTGNLHLAIVGSICHSIDQPFGPDCKRNGVAYVSFAQWVAVILVYTLVYHMMEPPMEYYEVADEREKVEEERGQQEDNGVSRPLLVEAEWPAIEDKETENSKTALVARIFNSVSNLSVANGPDVENDIHDTADDPEPIRCLAAPKVIKKMRTVAEQTPVQHILQPPTIASLFAILVGMVPHLKAFTFGYDAPLSFITDSLEILAGAMVPSVMLILGGMLAEGPNESKLGLRTMIGISVARLFVLPLLGIGVVTLANKMNILVEGDHMYTFVLLLQYTTPSAILLGAIASLRGYAVSEASALIFWQHLLALISLSLYIVVYFKMFSFS
ncbi:putative Mediator of RNA polymerase II transcription subunit 18 [Capsicum annuum]|uniref:protein PIN-LIKES 2-like n=1 Tax=Capsicum annuum TaxID=4072 RepID=UPI001FB07F5A|nr:protein PIN-LIKES 2-like [Capsicum annuum]KAF3677827.1 putative Mediator of RNA polymerase II transcription subunit 18 [Capsicum annuum]